MMASPSFAPPPELAIWSFFYVLGTVAGIGASCSLLNVVSSKLGATSGEPSESGFLLRFRYVTRLPALQFAAIR